jgi:hypothetical protein
VLTATVTALELDTQRLPTTEDDTTDFPNYEDASSQEVTDEASTPHPFSSANNWDNESDTEERPLITPQLVLLNKLRFFMSTPSQKIVPRVITYSKKMTV